MGICQIISTGIITDNTLLSTIFGDIMFIVAIMIVIKLFKQNIEERLKLVKVNIKTVFTAIVVALVFNIVFQSSQFLFPISMRAELFSEMDSELGDVVSVIGFIATVIVAPIAEEILFRGLILGELTKCFNVHIAIVLQAVLFGVMHGNIIWATIAFLSAVLYGYFIKKYESIFTSILGHMSVNLLSFIVSG